MSDAFKKPTCRGWVLWVLFLSCAGLGALNVTLLTPFSWQNSTAWTLNFTVTGNATNCSLYTNETNWAAVANTTTVNASNNSFSHNFAEGNWLWSVACADANGTVFSAANASAGVDLTPPFAPGLSVAGYNVSWSGPASDGLSGFSRFELYRNNSLVLNSTNASLTQFFDANATANATCAYRLDVVDYSGNRNSSAALSEPLVALANFTVVQVAPRTFNVSWLTDVPANETLAFSYGNGTALVQSNASLKKIHSLNLTTPVFGPINGTVVSCVRGCLGQAFAQPVPPTINISMVFYNATYNNQSALLQLRWDSLYGLMLVTVNSNNSGTDSEVYSSALPRSVFHTQNLTFVINDTAAAVVFWAKGLDGLGETVQTAPYTLHFNPNVTQPIEPPAPNSTYAALHIGQSYNVSNGYAVRLLGLSNVPVGSEQLLSAVLETYDPQGRNESRFSIEENGRFNTSFVSVALYRIFIGSGNTSYAQVYAEPLLASTPSPSSEPTVRAQPSVQDSPSPTPVANATQPPPSNNTESVPSVFGKLIDAQVSAMAAAGSIFSGYVLASDGTTPMEFNASYAHQGAAASVYFLVRIQDAATNQSAGVVRSASKKASDGKTLFFSTDPINLPSGSYRADAVVVAEDQNAVLDSKALRFSVKERGSDDAVALVGGLCVLALGVFLFTLKINHHKKGMNP